VPDGRCIVARGPVRAATWAWMNLSRNSYGPIALGVALFALGIGAWRALVVPRMPERYSGTQTDIYAFVDLPGATTPVYRYGTPRPGGILFAGDSRVSGAFLRAVLERHGIPGATVLMGPTGQLRDSLAAARAMPLRRLVLGLSPLSVYAPLGAGTAADLARERGRSATERIDGYLGQCFARTRRSVARPLEARHWTSGWFERSTESADQPYYRTLLRAQTKADRAIHLRALEAELRALIDAGWRVACVRLPAGAVLQEIEDAALDRAEFHTLCARLGVPYFDHLDADYRTSDGSHLEPAEAARYSADFARELLRAAPDVARP